MDFEFFPEQRRLERKGAPVQISSRALDILRVLTERPGEMVSKRELLDRVWPHAVVDEGSIRFHMVALRRALGENEGDASSRFIVTVPGRGYSFVGAGSAVIDTARAASREGAFRTRLATSGWIVGRDDDVAEIAGRLSAGRCISIVGAGGLGKSAVAAQAAVRWREAVGADVAFVDLGDLALDAPEAVATGLVAALRAPPAKTPSFAAALKHLAARQTLLVLDTCEAAIDAVAQMVGAILSAAPQTCLLATSREALRVEGEYIYRLKPLPAPAPGVGESAAMALRYPAVQLFAESAAHQGGFELRDTDAPTVADICRRLDGLPLAIEMAASRVAAFGIRDIHEQLSTGLVLHWPGSRIATPRHQTLMANLDWSHDLLADRERAALRRLSRFGGPFSLDTAVAADPDPTEMMQAIPNLVEKSLLAVQDGSTARYRMFEMTRLYTRIKSA